MKFQAVEKFENELSTAFKGDFFRDYISKFSEVIEDFDVLSQEEIIETKDRAIGLSFFLENNAMSSWQNDFRDYFISEFKKIERDVILFLENDLNMKCILLKNGSPKLCDTVQLQDVSVYTEKNKGVVFSFSSTVHEGYCFDVRWLEGGIVEYTDISS